MKVWFAIHGRLGNAIFRYMASAIICIVFNAEYFFNGLEYYTVDMTDQLFLDIADCILKKKHVKT